MTTSKNETLTDKERVCLLHYAGIKTGDGVAEKALRIIDAHAAERAALTEQVAQAWAEVSRVQQVGLRAETEVARLTEALAAAERREQAAEQNVVWVRDQRDRAESELHVIRQVNEGLANSIKGLHKERIQLKTLASAAEREVARLTEALAAAEARTEAEHVDAFEWRARAEAAERDRDAARALLRKSMPAITGTNLRAQIRAHLSSQPAAPARTDSGVAAMTALHQMVLAALAAQGLHVVTAADKAVLEACEALSHSDLLDARDDGRPKWNRFAHAELARRGSAK